MTWFRWYGSLWSMLMSTRTTRANCPFSHCSSFGLRRSLRCHVSVVLHVLSIYWQPTVHRRQFKSLILISIWLSCQLTWIQREIHKQCHHAIGFRYKFGWKEKKKSLTLMRKSNQFSTLLQRHHIIYLVEMMWNNVDSTSFCPVRYQQRWYSNLIRMFEPCPLVHGSNIQYIFEMRIQCV